MSSEMEKFQSDLLASVKQMRRGEAGRVTKVKVPAATESRASSVLMNRWNIPRWLAREVMERDQSCVYCRTSFVTAVARRNRPSWEHIVNDASVVTRENIALCCIGCNASKGAMALAVWLDSRYCAVHGITLHSLAPVAQAALAHAERHRQSPAQEPPGGAYHGAK